MGDGREVDVAAHAEGDGFDEEGGCGGGGDHGEEHEPV